MANRKTSLLLKALGASIKTKSTLSVAVSIAGFAMAFMPALMARTLQRLTDAMQQLTVGEAAGPDAAMRIFGMLALLFLVQAVFNFLQDYTRQMDLISIHKYIKQTILRHKCEVRYQYIENFDSFQDRITFADSFAGYQVATSMQSILNMLQKAITFASVSYLLYTVNPLILAALLVTSVPAVILSYKQKDELFRHQAKWMEEGHLTIHYFHICSGEEAIEEIRHYGLFDYLKARWRAISDDYSGKKNKLTAKHVKYNAAADFLRNIVYIAVLLLAAYEIYRNPAIGLGTFTLVFTLSGQMQEVTAALFVGMAQFFSDIPYMKAFFYLDTLEREDMDPEVAPLNGGDISVEHLDFTYPNGDRRVLHDISVSIREGEKVAIVGENGSGKSTFANLLCGMFEPEGGRILVDGRPVGDNLAAVRNSISVVFQDFGHYEATLRYNITVSDKRRGAADGEILELAKRTNTIDVIEQQPQGLEEQVGSFGEKGNDLSGGQWQKIAIARAAYRQGGRIMILDEPTAALDPLAETRLYSDFAKLTGNKTTILISHRLGITTVVDRILVFHEGRIVEDGSHRELIEQNGYYATMYRAQAQYYA